MNTGRLLALLLCLTFLGSFCACSNNAAKSKHKKNPVVTIEMESGDIIEVELYPNIAPQTVDNFVSLVKKGFYDQLTFHRIIPGFMIQGGDPEGTGYGGPGYCIKGEFKANGFDNGLKHTRGVISMARSDPYDTAGSQFFIMVSDNKDLDGQYAAFGKVTRGMSVADGIAAVQRDKDDKPLTPQVMKKVTVNTFGEKYDQPDRLKAY